MARSKRDVVDCAVAVLAEYGLGSLTMRRLATELDVRPSALYHHVPNKQTLLTEVADELLRRGKSARQAHRWDQRVIEICDDLRDAMLACRDGAEVVVTAHTYGMGDGEPAGQLREALWEGELSAELIENAVPTLLHLVFGHTLQEQTALQAVNAGAIEPAAGRTSDFHRGLELLLDGIRGQQHDA